MQIKRWLYCTVVLLTSPLFLQAQDSPCGRVSQPAYEDSEDGLNRLFTHIITALNNKDEKLAKTLAESLIIPNPNRCFESTGGGFRSVDIVALSALATAPPLRIRVGGNVQGGRIISKPPMRYPEAAKRAGLRGGTVRLRAVIATDGTIKELEVLSGPSELIESALEAVRQWRYQPTFLNGVPVEVQTTIDVVYTLSP